MKNGQTKKFTSLVQCRKWYCKNKYKAYTGWFRALVQYPRRLLWRSFGTENVNKVFPDSPPFPSYNVLHWCRFYNCNCQFLQNGNNLFQLNMPIDILVCNERKKERKKANSALCSIFQSSFHSTFFSTFLFVQWGLVSALNVLYICYNRYSKCLPSTWTHTSTSMA
jgi:hypothetical protein